MRLKLWPGDTSCAHCFCPASNCISTSIVPSMSSVVKSILWGHGALPSLTSLGDFPHFPVLLTFSYNCTCCLCLHSFQGFAYRVSLSFLTILIQTYWSFKDHLPFGKIRVNYASAFNNSFNGLLRSLHLFFWFSYLSFSTGCGLCILHVFYLLKWCSGFWWNVYFFNSLTLIYVHGFSFSVAWDFH